MGERFENVLVPFGQRDCGRGGGPLSIISFLQHVPNRQFWRFKTLLHKVFLEE